MRIGITGSTGFLGANLVRYLYNQGSDNLDVICFYAHRKSNPLTAHLDVHYRQLDVLSRKIVFTNTENLDALFHIAGVVDYSRKSIRKIWDVNVLGAKNIFDAALRNDIPKVIYISSINALGTVQEDSFLSDETNEIYTSPENPISFANRSEAAAAVDSSIRGDYGFLKKSVAPYFDSKLAAYELALAYRDIHNLPVITVFPGTAVGGGDVGFSISRLIYHVFTGRMGIATPGSSSFVSARDVAAGIWLCYLRGKLGQSYIVTGRKEHNMEYRDFMRIVAKVAVTRYGRSVNNRIYRLPRRLCYILAKVMKPLVIDSQVSTALLLSGCANHRFTHEKASRELGYKPKVELEDAISECIDFYLRHSDEIAS
jgi:dihydroflavonol-4-reductase